MELERHLVTGAGVLLALGIAAAIFVNLAPFIANTVRALAGAL